MEQRKIIKVCHLTSAHPRNDVRVFVKMSSSSAKKYKTYLIVADGNGDQVVNNISIVDVGINTGGRLNRMFRKAKDVYRKAVELNCDIYHFHDPELLYYGLKLEKKHRKKVVYDAHENVPEQIMAKDYLPRLILPLLSFLAEKIENYIAKRISAVVVANPPTLKRFQRVARRAINVRNFPVIEEFISKNSWELKDNSVCYIGVINESRGFLKLLDALSLTKNKCFLELAGRFDDPADLEKMKSHPVKDRVNYHGMVDRETLADIIDRCKVGVVTFLALDYHLISFPNKLYEYMSASIPVVASDFPLWEDIVAGNNCGVCVDPNSEEQIAKAIDFLLENSSESKIMGSNGKNAICEKYNWNKEEIKLFDLYDNLIL